MATIMNFDLSNYKPQGAVDMSYEGLIINLDYNYFEIKSDGALTHIWPQLIEGGDYFDKVETIKFSNIGQLNDINIPNWPNVVDVTIVDCCSIIHTLPEWSKLKYIYFNSCITILPNWSKVKRVRCNDILVNSFPAWPELTHIECVYVTINAFPMWPKIQQIVCTGCTVIELPCWPTLISFEGANLNVQNLPNWLQIRDVICDDHLINDRPLLIWPNIHSIMPEYDDEPIVDADRYRRLVHLHILKKRLLIIKIIKKWLLYHGRTAKTNDLA